MFDIRPFFHPTDPWPGGEPEGLPERIYDEKFRLAALLQPRTILEIGVRYGYSAAAFLTACPDATYLGIDADLSPWGGAYGGWIYGRDMLAKRFPGRTRVVRDDTQKMAALPAGPWDLIHVDGDHSYQGCLNDLRLATRAGPRWILVDDQANSEEVPRASQDWLRESGWRSISLPTVRGDLLAQRPREK